MPNHALRDMFEPLASKHPRGIGLATKNFFGAPGPRQSSIGSRAFSSGSGKQTTHRVKLGRECPAAGTGGIWANKKVRAKSP